MNIQTIAVLSACALIAASIPALAAPTLSASDSASAYGTDGWDYTVATPINNRVSNVTPLDTQFHVVFNKQSTGVSFSPQNGAITVSTTVGANAGLGDLHVYALAQGTNDDSHNYYYGSGTADATASFTDTFTINPTAAHAYGTWALIHAQLAIDETHSNTPGSTIQLAATLSANGSSPYDSKDESGNPFGANNYLYYSVYDDGMGNSSNRQNIDILAEFRVGSTYTIQGDLNAHVVINLGNFTAGYIPGNGLGLVDAFNTSHSYLWSDDPTISITTGSGASYALPTPEPSTLACLLLASPALLARRRRKD